MIDTSPPNTLLTEAPIQRLVEDIASVFQQHQPVLEDHRSQIAELNESPTSEAEQRIIRLIEEFAASSNTPKIATQFLGIDSVTARLAALESKDGIPVAKSLSREDAARYLGISLGTLDSLVTKGEIKRIRVNSRVFIYEVVELDNFVKLMRPTA